MPRWVWLTAGALALTAAAVFISADGPRWLWPELETVRPVPEGDHEIAWLREATSANAWERFVAGARHAAHTCGLTIDDSNAFPDRK